MFIAIEGIDGTGKTTITEYMLGKMREMGLSCFGISAPGETAEGHIIRNILLSPVSKIPLMAQAFLYWSDMILTGKRIIEPELERGTIIISDRWVDSSLVYQVDRPEFDDKTKTFLYRIANNLILPPHVTFILDLPIELAIKRSRKKKKKEFDKTDSKEAAPHEEWLQRRASYLSLPLIIKREYHIIDVSEMAPKDVFYTIWNILNLNSKEREKRSWQTKCT